MKPRLNFSFAVAALCLAVFSSTCAAAETGAVDFLASLAKPSLVLFYSRDCIPCHAEMAMLPHLAEAAQGWNMTIAAITPPDAGLVQKAAALNIRILDLSGAHGVAVLKSLNNNQLAMPFSLATDKSGAVCAQRTGLLGTDVIKEWRVTCSL